MGRKIWCSLAQGACTAMGNLKSCAFQSNTYVYSTRMPNLDKSKSSLIFFKFGYRTKQGQRAFSSQKQSWDIRETFNTKKCSQKYSLQDQRNTRAAKLRQNRRSRGGQFSEARYQYCTTRLLKNFFHQNKNRQVFHFIKLFPSNILFPTSHGFDVYEFCRILVLLHSQSICTFAHL